MATRLYTDSASGRLAADIIPADTSITLEPGQGVNFPVPSSGDWAILTLEDAAGAKERVMQTGRAGDVLTVVRAQEGTTALPFLTGSRCELRLTSSAFSDLAQKSADETITGDWTFENAPGGAGMDQFARQAANEQITGAWTFTGNVITNGTSVFGGGATFNAAAGFFSTAVFNNAVTFNGSVGGPGTDVFGRLADNEVVAGAWIFTGQIVTNGGISSANIAVQGNITATGIISTDANGRLTGSPDVSVSRHIALTQAAYNALPVKDSLTLYYLTT